MILLNLDIERKTYKRGKLEDHKGRTLILLLEVG